MTPELIVAILFIHWIGDFVLQLPGWAETKWYNRSSLIKHAVTYGFILFGGVFCITCTSSLNLNTFIECILFSACNAFIHYAVDRKTSIYCHNLFSEKRIHDFFVIIGLDQFIHTSLLLISYPLIFSH